MPDAQKNPKNKDIPPTVDDILRGSAHALTVFKPDAADALEIYLKRGKPYPPRTTRSSNPKFQRL